MDGETNETNAAIPDTSLARSAGHRNPGVAGLDLVPPGVMDSASPGVASSVHWQPAQPVTWPAPQVGEREDHDFVRLRDECDRERKARQEESPDAESFADAGPIRPRRRALGDGVQRSLELLDEVEAETRNLELVPVARRREVGRGTRMKADPHDLPAAPAFDEPRADGRPIFGDGGSGPNLPGALLQLGDPRHVGVGVTASVEAQEQFVSEASAVADWKRERGGEDVGWLGRHLPDYSHSGLTRQGAVPRVQRRSPRNPGASKRRRRESNPAGQVPETRRRDDRLGGARAPRRPSPTGPVHRFRRVRQDGPFQGFFAGFYRGEASVSKPPESEVDSGPARSKLLAKLVTGFNHNIKHKGKQYHIQTEDSGLENPHIITHLFVGGNILASKKTSYADIVGAENLAQVVRELMEEQHKEMLRNLVNGVYDDIDESYSQQAGHYQPGQIDTGGKMVQMHAGQSMQADPRAPRHLPPEVLAARQSPAPELRNDGAETLFGEDLISEKSLDEVILSYLAEDMGDRK